MTDTRARIDAILAADDRRLQACVDGDLDSLERLLTPDFTYLHATGFREGREPFLSRIRDGQVDYVTLSRVRADVRVHGDVALVEGDSSMTYRLPSRHETQTLNTLYLAVWMHGTSGWQLTAYSSTALTSNSPV